MKAIVDIWQKLIRWFVASFDCFNLRYVEIGMVIMFFLSITLALGGLVMDNMATTIVGFFHVMWYGSCVDEVRAMQLTCLNGDDECEQ